MDSYQLYKSIYDRELKRRGDLDSAINLPLTILTILVASNSYIVKDQHMLQDFSCTNFISIALILVSIGLTISIFFLTRSYNNFFKGFAYRNIGLTKDIRKYEADISVYNKKVQENEKIIFEDVIIDKLTDSTDDHIIFNDKRSKDLYMARTFLIISMIFTALNFFLITLKNIKL